jgi:hypothetical protein
MIRIAAFRALAGLLITASCLTSAVAAPADSDFTDYRAEPSLEGLYYDWSLYGMQESGNLACYLASGLERSSDNVPRRRPAVILITSRPSEGRKEIVSVSPGYKYEDGSAVLMTIGRKQFHLFTAGSTAWAAEGDDQPIVTAIRSARTLVVTGRMDKGPTTTDTFSLKGFAAALAALDQACPMPKPATAPKPTRRKKPQ